MFILVTGLPASGKTTLARALIRRIQGLGIPCRMLDGDDLRKRLSPAAAFDMDSRTEHLARVVEHARETAAPGEVQVGAFIVPLERHRRMFRYAFSPYLEVFLDVPLQVCRERDPKGLYKKAYAGMLPGMTGVDSPYERPERPDVVIGPDSSPEDAARIVCSRI